jgi:hypothetical protein
MLSFYNKALQRSPLFVTSLTTSFCYGVGDGIAQKIEIHQGKRTEIDKRRLGVFTLFGLALGGPIYYAWFSKIDKMPFLIEKIVKWNEQRLLTQHFRKQLSQNLKNNTLEDMSMKQFRLQFKNNFENIEKPLIRSKTVLVAKIYADQFIFSVLYPIFFMITSGTMLHIANNMDLENYDKNSVESVVESGKTGFMKSWQNVKDKFAQIYVMDCALWPLVQMANFAFIPSHLQPIFVNAINIGWNTFLSYASQNH